MSKALDLLDKHIQEHTEYHNTDSAFISRPRLLKAVTHAIEDGIYYGMELKNAPITPNSNNNLLNNTMIENNKQEPISTEELEQEQKHIAQAVESMVKALTNKLTPSQQNQAIKQLIIGHQNQLSLQAANARDEFEQKQSYASEFEEWFESFRLGKVNNG